MTILEFNNLPGFARDWIIGLEALKPKNTALAACLRAILYHDERGQGVGYAEAMRAARALLAAHDAKVKR